MSCHRPEKQDMAGGDWGLCRMMSRGQGHGKGQEGGGHHAPCPCSPWDEAQLMEHAHLGFHSLEVTAQCSWLGKAQPRPQTVLSAEGSQEVTFGT